VKKRDLFPDLAPGEPKARVRDAITRIRNLRGQVGHDGLTPAASRTLIDEVTRALEEIVTALDKEEQ
jgi:hypothetical protein